MSEFEGNGVYYAATELEAPACGGRAVAVLGWGNSAGQAAVVGVEGTFALEAVIMRDNGTGERRTLEASNLFVFIGGRPRTGWLRGTLALDDRGYLHTGAEAPAEGTWQRFGRRPFTLETGRPGVIRGRRCAERLDQTSRFGGR
ncbi:hypothetical protein LWP59_26195 [Amycolatopsis acidiphila]|uniref:Uncharacterized protein n=1 Tax=Amycolatopsis acidiphila TaxID=715473 RepID=A0A558ADT2_9PSEU|nr:hypothetical protein [Amycolatopsis acidiphila]TVT22422.1 hypothetical protein FNH06_13615 [Amycolatopsis acidiphila]UIJ57623.1 hypothetical protein LWP59_26195 [Amycolatopsis acidiphila]GHG89905.1 hypothetical protein GCM10017788_65000 [Amycolatopsis acidiphila]